jgi:hypothetical protein
MKELNLMVVVIPAKAGIQEGQASALKALDPGFRRGDEVIQRRAL